MNRQNTCTTTIKISWHCLEVEKRLENIILNYVNGEKGKEFSNCELVTS
jgi:hypothetical protein